MFRPTVCVCFCVCRVLEMGITDCVETGLRAQNKKIENSDELRACADSENNTEESPS